jgi:lipopolysaccharide export LptBFGC system permease protein LptF
MWRLHRYYLRELTINAGITLLVLFAIVVISLVARGIQRAQGGDLLDAVTITIFWSLDAFPHLLPISFLLATVLTFARANQDREIVALRSAGVSPRVPMTAAVVIGIGLSIVGSLAMHYVLPAVHFRKYRVIVEVVRNVVMNMRLGTGDDRISIPGTDVTLTYGRRADSVGDQDVVFDDCWLYLPVDHAASRGLTSPIVHVERVQIPLPDESSTALQVILEGGRDPLSPSSFRGWVPLSFPLRGISEGSRRNERDDDLGSDQLLSEVMRGMHEAPTGAKYTLNRRTCFAVLPLLLGPIGFCIALFARERGRALALVYALVPLALFYLADVLGARLLRVTERSEFGWLPALLLVAVGTPFCWRELRR